MRNWLCGLCGLTILAIFVLAGSVPAGAEDFPSKPIHLIVPFAPGGPSDIIARVIGQKVSDLVHQPVVIDTRPGAGGTVGTDVVAKAAPDGYTLTITSAGALAISLSLAEVPVPYDTMKDFQLITLVATVPELLVVAKNVPVKSMAELIALAKSKPGKLNFASSGPGSMPHLAGELFKISAGIDIVHVPYRGAAPAVNDLLGNQVEMMFADTPILLPQVQSGALRAIAIGSKTRFAALPDVPTMAELGLPQVEAENWYGLVAPAATPPAIVAKIHDIFVEAMRAPEVKAKLASQGAILVGDTPDEFAAYTRREISKWAKVVQQSGAKQ